MGILNHCSINRHWSGWPVSLVTILYIAQTIGMCKVPFKDYLTPKEGHSRKQRVHNFSGLNFTQAGHLEIAQTRHLGLLALHVSGSAPPVSSATSERTPTPQPPTLPPSP